MRSLKPKKCRICGELFQPRSTLQRVCSVKCGAAWARELKVQEEAKADKLQREKMKTRADWMKEAQAAVNSFIRLRDHGKPCISCGRYHSGKVNAGHYLTVGARPELRFHPLNIHVQCEPCNSWLSGNLLLYRQGLIERIGLPLVEWLEGPHDVYKWTIEDLQDLKAWYKSLARDLAKSQEMV